MSYAEALGTTDQELAESAGIPLRILLAIRAVESGGRTRAVRFEPHVFHARTGSNPTCRNAPSRCTTAQIRAAARPDYLSAIPWTPSGRAGRPSVSYVGSETNRAAFERAFRLDPAAAVRSTSWGEYQVLGGHLLSTQGGTPAQAVAAFDRDPASVGRAMLVSWFADDATSRALAQRGDVEALAERYNGSQEWGVALRRALERLPADLSTVANSTTRVVTEHPVAAGAGLALGVTVLGAGAAFAWWAYKRNMKRNRRRRSS